MNRISMFSIAVIGAMAAGAAPVVSNVTISQDVGREVTVTYDLSEDAIVTFDVVTNGVSIGAANLRNAHGDVNMRVSAGSGTIKWRPDQSCPGIKLKNPVTRAVVTAWALNAPPLFMSVSTVVADTVRFYVSEEALPYPVTDNYWKLDTLLMRRIPAAGVTWRMGSPKNEGGSDDYRALEIPHYVALSSDYYIGVYEVTKRQYANVTGWKSWYIANEPDADMCPAENMKFNQLRGGNWPTGTAPAADSGIDKFQKFTGLPLDLPTEAQWEYACRAGTGSGLNSGKETDANWWALNMDEVAWCVQNANDKNPPCTGYHTYPVGQKLENNWGLYDMHGNVMEWCLDYFSRGDAYYATFGSGYKDGDTVVDPKGPESGTARTIRGGYHTSWGKECRSSSRASFGESDSVWGRVGLRLACPVAIP